ncbi:MAG: leucyl aminopeptidase family protein [Alphaproteobacteria bacterium]
MECFAPKTTKSTIHLIPLEKGSVAGWLKKRAGSDRAWVEAHGFDAKPGSVLMLPGDDGGPTDALVGVKADTPGDIWSWGAAADKLPAGQYSLPESMEATAGFNAGLGWALGAYRFSAYKKNKPGDPSKLVLPPSVDRDAVEAMAKAIYLTRDLINTPAEDMGPGELADAARVLARKYKAKCRIVVGDDLLKDNYPMIHAVGRASSRTPRLIDLKWGRAKDPKLTLVGKGVCFDSGGLDLKPSNGMLLMKKDMGGAANVLGLASMIMASNVRVRLRVLIPAVENSVSGNAFRPMDILNSRKGLSVEIGNTDAEGRLVLADALTAAAEDKPDMVLDFATLTGAARVAVGTEIAAFFANDPGLSAALSECADAVDDPVWPLPLHKPYRRLLDSKAADINNVSPGGYAGAITAALFLQEFVPDRIAWAHFDIMAWNTSTRAGHPEGGEAMGIRAAFEMIRRRYAG